ncbi:MAG: cob(I)yrinic acid a,c-diamide adenosyltransferase, partial [Bdellovibrionales bacterium]
MRIYTKTGDTGTSSLFSGKKVAKYHPRLKAYGTLDELNSHIGLFLSNLMSSSMDDTEKQNIKNQVQSIQNWLFTMGSHLACDDDKIKNKLEPISPTWAESLETQIDQWDQELPELKNFILPGGHQLASQMHICRTVCRRA